ncbi:MAG: hypothetical protein R3E53_19280 [Myxococcota bacterium]
MFRRVSEPLQLSEACVLAMRPALNAPVLNVDFLPVGPARAAAVVFAEEYGDIGLALGIRSVEGGQIVVLRNRESIDPTVPVPRAMERLLAEAERLGFLFDEDLVESAPAGEGRSQAMALWGRLMGDSGPSKARARPAAPEPAPEPTRPVERPPEPAASRPAEPAGVQHASALGDSADLLEIDLDLEDEFLPLPPELEDSADHAMAASSSGDAPASPAPARRDGRSAAPAPARGEAPSPAASAARPDAPAPASLARRRSSDPESGAAAKAAASGSVGEGRGAARRTRSAASVESGGEGTRRVRLSRFRQDPVVGRDVSEGGSALGRIPIVRVRRESGRRLSYLVRLLSSF